MTQRVVYALNFSRWKRGPLRLCFPDTELQFASDLATVPDGATLVVWGMAAVPDAGKRGWSIIRVEDGFLRSIGLGADLIRPVSWVVDRQGIYFDAGRSSDLEFLLANTSFTDELRHRAARLRGSIIEARLTKYNVGNRSWQRPSAAQCVVLVPGQVESDASLAYGAPGLRTNLELLQAVRAASPQAYVVYKPHPDVVAGMRAQGRGEASARAYCDEVVVDVPMAELLAQVDEVHVLTSLAGFEGLLRGKRITCYGQPFYAGWGLTCDMQPIVRRQRVLSLDELVAGVLLLYPCYMNRRGDAVISAEEAITELVAWRASEGVTVSLWRKLFRVALRRIVGIR